MLNHFNFDKLNGQVLITNDLGKYHFLSEEEFSSFVTGTLAPASPLYSTLREKYFLLDRKEDAFDEDLIATLRDMKDYTFSGPTLHIFVMTNLCNINCIYCQARVHRPAESGFMSIETGRKAVDLALQSPAEFLTFEFQGGEPLLNFPVIRDMILYTEKKKGNRQIAYTIVSNLIALTEEIIAFFKKYHVSVSTSLDGPQHVHEHNRPAGEGRSSFRFMEEGLFRLQDEEISDGAIQTTTRYSLDYPEEIVDTYRDHGLSGIFLRPLTPLGFAGQDWKEIGYTPEEFLTFYKRAFYRILEINRNGQCFPEFFACFFLRKILQNYSFNYMELRSPCGAGLGQLCYYYDGNVYTCDEGRMLSEYGDFTFRLGHVDTSSYTDLIHHPMCRSTSEASVIESLPGCSECVFQPYCGVCPVVNRSLEKDLFPRKPRGFRCRVYKGVQKFLFTLLQEGDPEILQILESWL